MISIGFDDGGVLEQLDGAEAAWEAELPAVLEEVAVSFIANQSEHFEDKSRGGTGADGKKWKPLAESTEWQKARRGQRLPRTGTPPKSQIGVDTGILRTSLGFAVGIAQADFAEVTIGYSVGNFGETTYADYFDEDRPLIPERTPGPWVDEAEEIIAVAFEEIVQVGR